MIVEINYLKLRLKNEMCRLITIDKRHARDNKETHFFDSKHLCTPSLKRQSFDEESVSFVKSY